MALFTVANVLPARLQPIPRDPWLFELRSLYAALLEDVFVVRDQARRSYKNQTSQSHLAKQVALDREWLLRDSDAHPFSFVKVCHVLGWEPEATRRAYFRGEGIRLRTAA